MKCVIVDDNPAFLAIIRSVLERGAITVLGTASSIAEAEALALEQRPDLAIVDIHLGNESGFDLAYRIRDVTSVILMSVHSKYDFAEVIQAAPVLGFISKVALSPTKVRELAAAAPRAARCEDTER